MEIKIIGEHLPVTESISTYIHNKFLHIPSPDKLQHVEFRLGKMKDNQYVHFMAHCAKKDIIIKTGDNNLYVAIDKMMEKIHRSFTKTKDKSHTHLYKALE